ncbi:predicted protein [Lichtheimia corymbifera JMRC:FSU:9682]|uniref:HAT C-terminal dimerisation domain-containing protein n=1 Tax=Lichtheimia corymbifera JMRC:FSU:9682 TaxID=1263082 RepID=A0A068SFU2_9FUNG|nr:predicted protein [Lichtheimia corymbifera JMRC:FSU:9682]
MKQETYPILCQATIKGQEKLQLYYARTDDVPAYAIATAMDPRAKFQWWVDEDWEEEYICSAKLSVQMEWQDNFKPEDTLNQYQEASMINGFRMFKRKEKGDQLAQYVEEVVQDSESNAEDILAYWKSRNSQWPQLSQMARKFLTIPASSTASERCFSHAKYVVPQERHAMKPETLKKCILVDSWRKQLIDM